MARSIEELRQMQALPLSLKIALTKDRIRQWINEMPDVYVSFSGGKDSTVLLDIARQVDPGIKAVFFDTMEFPEMKEFVRTYDNVDIIKPKMNYRQVIEKYGYPIISKEVSECVYGARRYLTKVLEQESLERTNERTKPPYAQFYRKLCGLGEYRTGKSAVIQDDGCSGKTQRENDEYP